VKFPLEEFQGFCANLSIPSKESGSVKFGQMLGTQRYALREIARGLEDDIRDYVVLKGRQQGWSTFSCALGLYWHLDNAGIQGLLVNDSDENHAYFRDILREMIATLPVAYRLPVVVDNAEMLRFGFNQRGHGGSRLMYQVAGSTKKRRGKIGRGRGINFHLGDELGQWTDQQGVAALEASFAEEHPLRLYLRGGTANGYDVLYELWQEAEHAVTKRRIFIGWWRKESYVVERGTPLWERYSPEDGLTADERLWVRAVRREYDVAITAEQIAWRRFQLSEKFRGDEVMLSQEHPNLPVEAFQSFGSKFIPPLTIRLLRENIAAQDAPSRWYYEFAKNLEDVQTQQLTTRQAAARLARKEPLLTVWEDPQPNAHAAYMVGARAAGSTTPGCPDSVATVWRLYPDRMTQVAEYVSEHDATYQFAWAVLHLIAAYGTRMRPAYLALEIAGTGMAVFDEIHRVQSIGFGLQARPATPGDAIKDFQAPVRHYLHRKLDSLTGRAAFHWKSNASERPLLMHGLRDQIERGTTEPMSTALIDELAMLRRGEGDEGDVIGAGGIARDGRAVTTALAVRHYLTVVDEIRRFIPPKDAQENQPARVDQALTQNVLRHVMTSGSRWR
jgi:hypothetical protein